MIDCNEGLLSGDDLVALKQFVPTHEEIESIKPFCKCENLGLAEKYFLEVSPISRLDARLESLYIKQSFRTRLEPLKEKSNAIWNAIQEMRASKKLKTIFEVVLAIGNYINGSTHRGGAYGFKIESLVKMAEIKQNRDPKQSLYHYIITFVEKKKIDAVDIHCDFPHLEMATREPTNQVIADLAGIRKALLLAEKELAQHADDSQDKLREILNNFVEPAMTELEQVEVSMREVDKKYKELINYFGEDETTDSLTFFSMMWRFINGLQRAKEDLERKKTSR